MFTPKIKDFNKVIDWLNTEEGMKIQKLGPRKEGLDNAWFSGFVDADGSFKVRATLKEGGAKKERFAVGMTIDQRMIGTEGESYEPIMRLIAKEFNGSLGEVLKGNGKTYYHLNCHNQESIKLLKNYFSKYPLMTSKYLDYVC